MNPIFLIDFYKVGHINQYPEGTTKVYVNLTARSTRTEDKTVVFFGLQYAIKVLLEEFDTHFFSRPLNKVLSEYHELISVTLGDPEPRLDHIRALWKLKRLPIDIFALPEGESVPLGVPMFVMVNTHDEFFWLPNYLETVLSNLIWKPCTSATTARNFRALFLRHAILASETDFTFVDYQGHDFSFRGMSGREDAILSGMGHLLSFYGTDTIPAIIAAQQYYGAGPPSGRLRSRHRA